MDSRRRARVPDRERGHLLDAASVTGEEIREWRAINNEKLVDAPDGKRYLVRVTRAGVHRYAPIGGLPNLLAVIFTWVRYLVRRDRSWAVEVRPVGIAKY